MYVQVVKGNIYSGIISNNTVISNTMYLCGKFHNCIYHKVH